MARLLSDFREWGLILLLVLLPLPYGAVEPWAKSAYTFMVILLAAAWALEMNITEGLRWQRTPLDIPLGLLLVWGIITTWTSTDRHDSIAETALFASHMVVVWLVAQTMRDRDQVRRLGGVLIAAGTGLSAVGLLQYLDVLNHDWWHIPGFLSATYVNHNHFAGYLELLIPLTIGFWLYARRRWERTLLGYALSVMAVAFVLTLSRGGWLALAGGLLAMVLLLRAASPRREEAERGLDWRRGRRWMWVAGASIVVLAFLTLAADALIGRMSTFMKVGEDPLTFQARPRIYRATSAIISEHPVVGTGPGTFVHAFARHRPPDMPYRITYAHNDYLQLAAELGIVGALLFLIVGARITAVGIAAVKATRSQFRRYALAGLLAGVWSLALHSLVDFNLHIPANAALVAVWTGVLMGYGHRPRVP